MQIIIFPNENGGVSVIIPAPEYADQIEAVANKNAPQGAPWRIVDAEELPSREFRDKWQWTESGPLTVAED